MTKQIWLIPFALAFISAWSFASELCPASLSVHHPTQVDFEYASGFRAPSADGLPALQASANQFGKPQSLVNLKDLVRWLHEFSYLEHHLVKLFSSEESADQHAALKLYGRMAYLAFQNGVHQLSQHQSEELAPYFAELCVIAGNLIDSSQPGEALIELLIKQTGISSHISDLKPYRTPTVVLLSEKLAGTKMTPERFDEFRYWFNDWFNHEIESRSPEGNLYSLAYLMCIQIAHHHEEQMELNPDYFKFLASYLPRRFDRKKKPAIREMHDRTAAFLKQVVSSTKTQPELLDPRELARVEFLLNELLGEAQNPTGRWSD